MKTLPRKNGFTLVELIVVITIIIVLAGITFSVTRNARTSSSKVADMQKLRSLSTAAMAAGADNAGRLPSLHSGSYAPYWLLSRTVLESYGITRESCYAPTRDITGGAPDYKWWYMDASGTPTHYVYFANDGSTPSNGWSSKGNVVPPDRKDYRGAIPYDDIIKDKTKAFARSLTDDAWYPILWAGLCRDFGGTRLGAITRNDEVLGMNVLYLDGHGEWVPMEKMKVRYTSGGLGLLW
jgi:prepilin-type N-terminal cleavage/methylation domain-containing protein/prepilin-type processing-associated H-X9-DG protein